MNKKIQIVWVTCFVLLFAAQNKIRVCAQVEYSPEKETLSMQSVGDSDDRGIEVEFSEVDEGAVVRVVSDNTDIVGFEYYSREKDIDVSDVDTLEITGNDESWDDDFMIVPRRAGTCNVMVYVNDTVDKTWKVTVKPTKPIVKLEDKEIWGADDTTGIAIKKLSKYAEVTLKSNKPLTLYAGYEDKAPKITLKNKNKKISGEKIASGLTINTTKNPVSGGKRKITVKIKQDNKTYSYVLKLNIKSYTSPFQSFKIGSVDFTKKFQKHRFITDTGGTMGARVSVKTAKKTINPKGAGKPFTIKMKDGYTVEKIEYREKGNWGSHKTQSYSVRNGVVTGTLHNEFWELYIYYKKGSKKGYTEVFWSGSVFAD